MKDQKIDKQSGKREGVSPIVVAVAGAVVGAGIAVAGVVLADEKNREKVKKAASKVKEGVVGYAENVKKQGEIKKIELEKKIAKDKEIIKKVVSSAKNSLDKTTKEVNKAVKSL